MQSPSLIYLTKVTVQTFPKNTGDKIDLCLEIMDGKTYKILWTNNPKVINKEKNFAGQFYNKINTYKAGKDDNEIMEININTNFGGKIKFCGDLYFRMINAKN